MLKVKEFFQKIKIDKIIEFLKKNARYFGAAAVFVAMVLILARCTDGTTSDRIRWQAHISSMRKVTIRKSMT